MKIPAQKSYNKAPVIDPGTYAARIVSILSIGLQENEWEGVKSIKPKVRITFEVPSETYVFNADKGPQPYVFSKEETLSSHAKAGLTKLCKAVSEDASNPDMEIEQLLDKTLMLSIDVTESGEYNNIKGYSPMMKGLTVGDRVNPLVFFDAENPDKDIYDTFPEFIKDKIEAGKKLKDADPF